MKITILLSMLTFSLATIAHGQQISNGQPAANATKKVCIVGRVMNEREIIFDGQLTVTDAIKQAGGIRPDQASNEAIVLSQMVNDWQTRIIFVDLKKIRKKPYMDLLLQDGDIVQVRTRKPYKATERFVNPCPGVPVFKDRM